MKKSIPVDNDERIALRVTAQPSRPYRILTDLSYATLGYCGLAQESRLFLKTLWRLGSVNPTGLVFSRGPSVLGHRFDSSEQFDRKIEDQALFLQTLVDGPDAVGWRKWLRFAQCCYRRLWSRSVGARPLDNERFWDTIWRNLLSRTLADADIDLARECPFLLANIGGAMLGGATLLA